MACAGGFDLKSATSEIGAIVEENRSEIARLRRLPPIVEEAFLRHDIYRMIVPVDLGGGGASPADQLSFVESISFQDASAGWNIAVGSGLGMFSGYFPRSEVETLYSRDGAAMAGSGAPQGRALKVDDGYVISGRFSWASGIDQACWVYGGCFVHDENGPVMENGVPMIIMAFAPKQDATVHACWNVGGLVATNSTEFTLDNVLVPRSRTIRVPWTGSTHPDPLFRLPASFFGFALTGVPLGVARRCVVALGDLAKSKPVPGGGRLADDPTVQLAVARAAVLVEAGRANVDAAFDNLWQTVVEAREPDLAQRARLRRACAYAAESSAEAVRICYRAAGSAALFDSLPFEAALRDVHAMNGHLVFQQRMMADAGRVMLGENPTIAIF